MYGPFPLCDSYTYAKSINQ